MADKSLKIDSTIFFKRLKLLLKWLNNEKAESILVINGNDTLAYSKTLTIHQWLFGYCLPNSAIILNSKKLYILASKRVGMFLKPVIGNDKDLEVNFLERNKSDDDKEIISVLCKNLSGVKLIGHLAKDNFEGKFFESVKGKVNDMKLDFVDISSSLSAFFVVKDDVELEKIKVASEATAKIFQDSLKESILNAVDVGKKVKHSELTGITEKYVEKAAKGNLEGLDVCYPPIVQSGGKYSLKFSVESDDNNLHMGVIVCSMGLRCDYYCSNIIRTIMINATAEQREVYEYLADTLYAYAIEQIQPGKQFADVATSIAKKLTTDRPHLAKYLLSSFGFCTGVEFKDRFLSITSTSHSVFKKNMAVIFYIGLENVQSATTSNDKRAKMYSVWIGDTIVVAGSQSKGENREVEIGGNIILTGASKRRSKNNLFQLKDDVNEEATNNKPLAELENYGRGQRRNAAQSANVDATVEEKRRVHQVSLYDRMISDCEKRIRGVKTVDDNLKRKKNHISYKTLSMIPKDEAIHNSHIFIDKRSHTSLFYPSGFISPYHMSIIKNVSYTEEGDKSYLRVNFNAQGFNTLGKTVVDENTDDVYIKELTIKTSNMKVSNSTVNYGAILSNVFHTIKDEQRRFKASELQAQENSDLIQQDTIVVNARKEVPKLKDLHIRPTVSKSRVTGNLECHQNGLRFSSGRAENVDILFNNIKHAFFQPCEKEMIVLIHFHLKNPIIYNKKKQIDIQFYTEVGELTTDLGKLNNKQDRDDLESEQREKELRRKINEAFSRFCSKVQEISNEKIDFDQPFRKLGFHGCPFRSTVFLQPTTSCLVQLTEWPPFVVTMDELELAFFERVNLSNKSFDLVLVFKNYNEKPVTITSLPQDKLEDIKSWLDHIDIFFSEGGKSLNWIKIMKNITDDPKKFLEDGGWAPLVGDSEGEDEDEDMEDDDQYAPSDSESSDAEDSDSGGSGGGGSGVDDESDWDAEENSDEDGDEELGSDESRGMDWDELEAEAKKADQEKEFNQPAAKKRRR